MPIEPQTPKWADRAGWGRFCRIRTPYAVSPLTKPVSGYQTFPESAATPARARRYTMLVLANDGADAVEAAGGLLFDRASAGWIVDVRTALPVEDTAFRILGVPVGTLADAAEAIEEWPDALVVSGKLHSQDAAVRDLFRKATSHTGTEVAMWGGRWPRDLGRGVVRVQHRLSLAAVAFKSHAMTAAGLPPEADAAEEFRSGQAGFALTGARSACP